MVPYFPFLVKKTLSILFFVITLSNILSAEVNSVVVNKNDFYNVNETIEHYIRLTDNTIQSDLDSAMYYAELAHSQLTNNTPDSIKLMVFNNLGDVYRERGNYSMSLENYLEALKVVNENKNPGAKKAMHLDNYAGIQINIGSVYIFLDSLNLALLHYDTAMNAIKSIAEIDPELNTEELKIKIYNNTAGIYLQLKEWDNALENYRRALEINTKLRNEGYRASLLNNIGVCYFQKQDYYAANDYFRQALIIRQEIGDNPGQAKSFNNLAKVQLNLKRYEKAREYSENSLSIANETNSLDAKANALKIIAEIYDSLRDYHNAYLFYQDYKRISDSINDAEKTTRIARLEMQYEFERQLKKFELEVNKLEHEKSKREFIYLLVAATILIIILILLSIVFILRNRISKAKLEKTKLELEHHTLNLEQHKLKIELETRNRELATNVMYLVKKNEIVTNIINKLKETKHNFKSDNQRFIQEIINELKNSQDNQLWEEFEVRFTQVHEDFYFKLNKLSPNLTPNEKKLCAFLKLNMSTKEIATITQQSANSITVARSRLRKKLQIEGEDINLVNFLMQL